MSTPTEITKISTSSDSRLFAELNASYVPPMQTYAIILLNGAEQLVKVFAETQSSDGATNFSVRLLNSESIHMADLQGVREKMPK